MLTYVGAVYQRAVVGEFYGRKIEALAMLRMLLQYIHCNIGPHHLLSFLPTLQAIYIYVYVCMYIYIYIYIYLHVCLYVYILYMYTYIYIPPCMHTYIHACMHTYIFVYVFMIYKSANAAASLLSHRTLQPMRHEAEAADVC
jgi:hypothetical protein